MTASGNYIPPFRVPSDVHSLGEDHLQQLIDAYERRLRQAGLSLPEVHRALREAVDALARAY